MRALLVFTVAATLTSGLTRQVFPFHYIGAMPDMVRMVDDPRQVGLEDDLIEPPRYGSKARDVKTHDFYPHSPTVGKVQPQRPAEDSDVIQSRVPQPSDPVNTLQPAPVPAIPVDDQRFQYFPHVPAFVPAHRPRPSRVQPGSHAYNPVVFPQTQFQGKLQCFAVGFMRNELMDAWCVSNCNHTPSYCPPSHCACNGYSQK